PCTAPRAPRAPLLPYTTLFRSSPHGQGEETTFAQIVADKFGIQAEDIEVIHGDTNRISMGWGTYGSRTTPVGGTAIAIAADRVLDRKSTRLNSSHVKISYAVFC